MIRVALRGIAGRKLRTALTMLAVVLGVAMVSGTYVFTDTIEKAIDTLLTDAYTGSDAVVSAQDVVDLPAGERPTIPAGLAARVGAQPEVAAVSGAITDTARLIGKDGDPISTRDQAIGINVDTSEPRFNPLRLTDGRWPAGAREIAIDAGTATGYDFAVGDTIGVATDGRVRRFTITGIAEFTTLDSLGGLTLAIFDTPTAQAFLGKSGRFDEILVAAKQGVSPERLVRAIRPILPGGAEVATGEAEVRTQATGTNKDIALVRRFMLAFGGLALFVGGFVIFNTASTTVAQRTRELATLRTLGASRRQVLGSVLLESLVIGAVASALGLVLGPALARGLSALFAALGQDLPEIDAVVATRTVVVSLLVGILITLVAGLFPALRATSVPPIAAVREGALPRSPFAPYAPAAAAAAAIAVGVGLLAFGMFAPGLSVSWVLLLLAVGCFVLFVGVALISSRLVKPLASVLAWPAARTGGAAGRLARQNSVRNPARTAVTASALMIGLALITFVAVLGQGLQRSLGDAVEQVVRADYVVTADDGSGPLAPSVARSLASQPGVETVSSIRQGPARVFGADESIGGVDPATISAVASFDWVHGTDRTFAALGAHGAVVQSTFADEHDLGVGGRFGIRTAEGKRVELSVRGIYAPPKFDAVLGPILLSRRSFDATFEWPQDTLALVDVHGDASGAQTGTLAQALAGFPEADLQTRAQFIDRRGKEIDDLLSLLYVLLALSVVVSLFGMVNTVALSVFERTRELGMLRAIGMTRRQVRRMVRQESLITGLIGAALGIPLGILLAALVTTALADEGVSFSLPVTTLVVFALVAATAGIVAAALPARHASNLDILDALGYE